MSYADLMGLTNVLVSYCQAVESQGVVMPCRQREGKLVNILAMGLSVQPLNHNLSIFDMSQTLGMNSLKVDGLARALATTSCLFSLGTATTLTTADMAKLMGHDLDEHILGYQ